MNILFIMYDQLRFDCLSCAGHPHLHTPNFDRVAAMGVRFTNALCPIADLRWLAHVFLHRSLRLIPRGAVERLPSQGWRNDHGRSPAQFRHGLLADRQNPYESRCRGHGSAGVEPRQRDRSTSGRMRL